MQILHNCVGDRNMDIDFFHDMLKIDSTTGNEGGFALWLARHLAGEGRRVKTYEVASMDGMCPEGSPVPVNILVEWGDPKVVFCTHLDTVPPYVSPTFDGSVAFGRGTCDAKGQIFAMYEACKALEAEGHTGFALLLLAGEETGSFGAKAFNAVMSSEVETSAWIIVGEPTDNCMASAAKGTKSFEVTFSGEPCHSGYPENGHSAVMHFNDFVNALRSIVFPTDPILGETTWNIGKLVSDNPQNILSDRLTCRVYFRTTFESDEMVCNVMKNMAGPDARLRFGRRQVQDGSDIVAKEVALWQKSMAVKAFGGDAPTRFEVLEGFPSKPVAFGSDAPQLTCFSHKILCGPGSILVAHRPEEHILLKDIEHAIDNYIRIYTRIYKSDITCKQ